MELGFGGASGVVMAKGLDQEQEANPRLKLGQACPILSKTSSMPFSNAAF
jgi:hypothetical protein